MSIDAGIGVANTMVSKTSQGVVTGYFGITNVDDLMNSVTCEDVTISDYAYIYIGGGAIIVLLFILVVVFLICKRQGIY